MNDKSNFTFTKQDLEVKGLGSGSIDLYQNTTHDFWKFRWDGPLTLFKTGEDAYDVLDKKFYEDGVRVLNTIGSVT